MTDTKKPHTTVAQDVAAFRAVLEGQHAQTEGAAEVLAEMADRYSGDAHLMHYHDRLSRALSAGTAVGVVEFDPRPADIAPQAWSERRVNWEDFDALPVGAKLYLAPPADPAKASGSAPDGWREFLDWCAANVSVSRGRAVFNDQEAFRSRLHAMRTATPPASAPEVTEDAVERVALALATSIDRDELQAYAYRAHARRAIAALQEKTNAR